MSPAPRSRATRDALVAAATDVVVERGYAGATARAIAARAGLNQALVFYHFGSVDQLLLAALEAVSARRAATFGPLLDEVRTLPDGLAALDRIVREDVRTGDLSFLVALLGAGRHDEALGRAVRAVLGPWQQEAERVVGRLARRYRLGRLLPEPVLARLAVALVLGLELLEPGHRHPGHSDAGHRDAGHREAGQTAGGPGEVPGATEPLEPGPTA